MNNIICSFIEWIKQNPDDAAYMFTKLCNDAGYQGFFEIGTKRCINCEYIKWIDDKHFTCDLNVIREQLIQELIELEKK